jgi:uncharacterized linocin/CFP29 family protein
MPLEAVASAASIRLCADDPHGDFELDIGQDISIGYLSRPRTMVELYLRESYTFPTLTAKPLSPRRL